MAREGVLIVIQRRLGPSNLGITPVYLQGIDYAEMIETVSRPTRTDDPRQRIATTLNSTSQQARLVGGRCVSPGSGSACRGRARPR
jgi:hypothetical protein